jgi:hypothetical protein
MDRDAEHRSPKTPFDVHFEGLLPSVAGQRFYSQMWDGWVWSIWRGQVVGAGTFRGDPIAHTPIEAFTREMRRWGVKHLPVWTEASRAYLAGSPAFVERWHDDPWWHFELRAPDVRSIDTPRGHGALRHLDWLGADVELVDVAAGDEVVVRTNY